MTAHKPRQTGPLDSSALIEVLFSGAPTPRPGWRVGSSSRVWCPPTNVYETEQYIVVEVEIACVQPDDFRIALYDRQLTVSGVRVDPHAEPRAYHQMEVHFGEFRTDVDLPGQVDRERIEAGYHQGLLRVTLPKLQPRRIEVS